MRVLIVNTSEHTGGAAIAAERLTEALRTSGVEAEMLVMHPCSQKPYVLTAGTPLRRRAAFLLERLTIWLANRLSRKNLFRVSIANTGQDITRLPAFREADVIHLHWINQGMLSLRGLRRILASGKPVVWTLHDMWPVTAVCHHAQSCTRYQRKCHDCPLLIRPGRHDLSARVFRRKQQVYGHANLTFVACSQWLENLARQSALTTGHTVTNIPNPLNTDLFHPMDKGPLRKALGLPTDKRLILFSSVKTTDPQKGMSYLIEACRLLNDKRPKLRERLAVVVAGKASEELSSQFPFDVFSLGYISHDEQMARVYNAVDLFVTPSLMENLPNTIAEAMACGIPCVGFRTGGIPQMIDHERNGYVADYCSAADLAEGICRSLDESRYHALSREARCKALSAYSRQAVATRYIQLYQQIISQND